MDQHLYETCMEYRRVVDELHTVRMKLGAVEAAYRNCISDQCRMKAVLGDAWQDDPGRGGSGGE